MLIGRRRAFVVSVLCGMALGLSVAGCHREPERHSTTGTVREMSPDGHAVTIAHNDFPGWMEGMVMTFDVPNAAMTKDIKPGDTVHFTLTSRNGAWPVTEITKIP